MIRGLKLKTKADTFVRDKFIWNKNFTHCLKIIGCIWVDFFLSVYLEVTTIRQRFSTNLLASIITKRQHEIYPINQTVSKNADLSSLANGVTLQLAS